MSTLKLDTLSNKAGTASVPSDTIVSGTAKAWVNFNGTGTVAIRRAFNVSSITDNGTGDYTVNFTNAMSDQYFACCSNGSLVYGVYGRNLSRRIDVPLVSGSVRLYTLEGAYDIDFCQVAIFS
jgi:hypothetical protein